MSQFCRMLWEVREVINNRCRSIFLVLYFFGCLHVNEAALPIPVRVRATHRYDKKCAFWKKEVIYLFNQDILFFKSGNNPRSFVDCLYNFFIFGIRMENWSDLKINSVEYSSNTECDRSNTGGLGVTEIPLTNQGLLIHVFIFC